MAAGAKPSALTWSSRSSSGPQYPSLSRTTRRLVVDPELLPGEHLEELVEAAEAAGQDDEPVGAVEHRALPGVHVPGDHRLRQLGVRHLEAFQMLGDHTDDRAAARQHRIGEHAHQADSAGTVNEGDSAPGQA